MDNFATEVRASLREANEFYRIAIRAMPRLACRAFGRTTMNLQTSPQPAHSLIGAVRRFGPHGVLYEVVRIVDDQHALIRVIDTGEETNYLLSKVFADPAA